MFVCFSCVLNIKIINVLLTCHQIKLKYESTTYWSEIIIDSSQICMAITNIGRHINRRCMFSSVSEYEKQNEMNFNDFRLQILTFWQIFKQNSYIICVYHGQVNPFLPYISDVGTQLPAAGYFSQILDTIGVIIMVIFYIRYRQIDYFLITVTISNVEQTNNDDNNMEKQMTDGKMIDKKLLQRLHLRNIIALIASIVAGFCVISIGNFRASEYLTLHCISVLVMVIAHSILVIENVCIIQMQMWIEFKIEFFFLFKKNFPDNHFISSE